VDQRKSGQSLTNEDFFSDFPHDVLSKAEFKQITENMTFGNAKIITNKAFRPSYGIAEG